MPRTSSDHPHVLDISLFAGIAGSHLDVPSKAISEILNQLNETYGYHAWEVRSREPFSEEWSLTKAVFFRDQCRYQVFHRGNHRYPNGELIDSWRMLSTAFTGTTLDSIKVYLYALNAGYKIGWKDSMNQVNTEANTGEIK